MLLTTHEPEIAAAIGTHLVLMRDGKVLQQGTMDEILTAEALSKTYRVPVRVRELDGKKVVFGCKEASRRMVILTGERGSGKTTLCTLLAEKARRAGWQVGGA